MSQSAKQYTPEEEAEMRARGLVPKTIWVYDVDAPGFREAMLEESRRLAQADAEDPTIDSFSDAAMCDIFEEIDRMENEK